jgi:hypothetical protein
MGIGPLRVEGDVASSGTPDSSADLVGRVEAAALETAPFDHVHLGLAVFIGHGLRT